MIVPFGENIGKHGGVMIFILMNKFSMGEDDKPSFENFNISTTPITNKVFQSTFVHVLNYNKLNVRVATEITDENFVFKIMDRIM